MPELRAVSGAGATARPEGVAAPSPSLPWLTVLRTVALIGGTPTLILALLVAGGWLAPLPGLLAGGATLVAALALARLWLRRLLAVARGLRGAGLATASAAGDPLPDPSPPLSLRQLAEETAWLVRRLQERGDLLDSQRLADAAILERLPDPLLVLTADRAPLRTNAAARALFAVEGDPGGMGGDLAALLRHPVLAGAVDRALAEAAPQSADLALPVPVARELAARVIPMQPALSDGGRIVVVLADRSRERAVERMRADFVANASHELRTPLASLIGFIETLRGPAEDDKAARTRFLGIMAEQSERMRRLIDDLLGLSRIELTEHQPPTGRASLAAILRAEAEALEPLARSRGARIALSLEEAAEAAPADAEQLAQVVRNLVENALRHGGRAGGTVRVSATRADPTRRGEGADRRLPARPGVLLTVEDDGPGIPREHLPRLTERFYRVDKGRSRSAGGTGLGLAIVKHIVNRHRGALLIDSEEGRGSSFRVWLPAAAVAAGELAPATPGG